MQRNIATTGKLAGALAITLALPVLFSTTARAAAAGDIRHADIDRAVEAANPEFNRWRDYALASITPRFSWAVVADLNELAPRVTDALSSGRPSVFATSLTSHRGGAQLGLSIANGAVSDTPARTTSSMQQLVETPQLSLQRSVATPTLSFALGDNTSIGVSAVLAYQRFASLGMGVADWNGSQRPVSWAARETSFGTGLRLDTVQRITQQLAVSASYQSRVNMDAFSTYRGVYADAGDFDVPSQTSFGISYALTPSLSADVGVDRMAYSGIKPFTSNGLPLRFLALLGDGLSPNFAWDDLTVYSAGWSWHNAVFGDLRFRYTTRQQPLPSSRMLAQAMQDSVSRYSLAMGWSQAIGRQTRVALLANYASAPYMMGMPSYNAQSGAKVDRLEFQALLSMAF